MKAVTYRKPGVKEDVWIHSVCDLCSNQCPVVVRRVNGTVVKIEGDPDGPFGNRRLCAKGFDVDPQWKEISWDDALDIISERLRKIRQEDPRKLLLTASSTDPTGGTFLNSVWGLAFGTPNTTWQGYFCGNYLHAAIFMTNGAFHTDYDADHCEYVIQLGTQMGFMVGYNANIFSQKMAEARMRGMKVVVVDPVLTNAAGKADEWVPIRPGTDGAFMLGLMNVLIHELGICDSEFIKKRTNGPYLVGPDGHYVRRDGKPLVWDIIDEAMKPFDAPVEDYALDGVYYIDGVECRPAFHYFKEAVAGYTPEETSKITTIPAEIIRRIAREFGEAAQIPTTVRVEDREIPYRPVAVNIYRGAGAHTHGLFTSLAVQVLQMLVGNYYAVGGHRGVNLVGPGKSWVPNMSSDGMIVPPTAIGAGADYYDLEVGQPQSLALNELLPISTNRSAVVQFTVEAPERFKIPYRPEMLIILRHNQLMTTGNPQRTAEVFKKIPFVVYFATHEDEQAAFADILLPDLHYLEMFQW